MGILRYPLNSLVLTAAQTAISRSLRADHSMQRSEREIVCFVDAHEAIVECLCARDSVGAGAAMARHFDLSVNSFFLGQLREWI